MIKHVVRFRFGSDLILYAGLVHGSFGFASSLGTALTYDDRTTAERVLENCYGDGTRPLGEVVTFDTATPESVRTEATQ